MPYRRHFSDSPSRNEDTAAGVPCIADDATAHTPLSQALVDDEEEVSRHVRPSLIHRNQSNRQQTIPLGIHEVMCREAVHYEESCEYLSMRREFLRTYFTIVEYNDRMNSMQRSGGLTDPKTSVRVELSNTIPSKGVQHSEASRLASTPSKGVVAEAVLVMPSSGTRWSGSTPLSPVGKVTAVMVSRSTSPLITTALRDDGELVQIDDIQSPDVKSLPLTSHEALIESPAEEDCNLTLHREAVTEVPAVIEDGFSMEHLFTIASLPVHTVESRAVREAETECTGDFAARRKSDPEADEDVLQCLSVQRGGSAVANVPTELEEDCTTPEDALTTPCAVQGVCDAEGEELEDADDEQEAEPQTFFEDASLDPYTLMMQELMPTPQGGAPQSLHLAAPLCVGEDAVGHSSQPSNLPKVEGGEALEQQTPQADQDESPHSTVKCSNHDDTTTSAQEMPPAPTVSGDAKLSVDETLAEEEALLTMRIDEIESKQQRLKMEQDLASVAREKQRAIPFQRPPSGATTRREMFQVNLNYLETFEQLARNELLSVEGTAIDVLQHQAEVEFRIAFELHEKWLLTQRPEYQDEALLDAMLFNVRQVMALEKEEEMQREYLELRAFVQYEKSIKEPFAEAKRALLQQRRETSQMKHLLTAQRKHYSSGEVTPAEASTASTPVATPIVCLARVYSDTPMAPTTTYDGRRSVQSRSEMEQLLSSDRIRDLRLASELEKEELNERLVIEAECSSVAFRMEFAFWGSQQKKYDWAHGTYETQPLKWAPGFTPSSNAAKGRQSAGGPSPRPPTAFESDRMSKGGSRPQSSALGGVASMPWESSSASRAGPRLPQVPSPFYTAAGTMHPVAQRPPSSALRFPNASTPKRLPSASPFPALSSSRRFSPQVNAMSRTADHMNNSGHGPEDCRNSTAPLGKAQLDGVASEDLLSFFYNERLTAGGNEASHRYDYSEEALRGAHLLIETLKLEITCRTELISQYERQLDSLMLLFRSPKGFPQHSAPHAPGMLRQTASARSRTKASELTPASLLPEGIVMGEDDDEDQRQHLRSNCPLLLPQEISRRVPAAALPESSAHWDYRGQVSASPLLGEFIAEVNGGLGSGGMPSRHAAGYFPQRKGFVSNPAPPLANLRPPVNALPLLPQSHRSGSAFSRTFRQVKEAADFTSKVKSIFPF